MSRRLAVYFILLAAVMPLPALASHLNFSTHSMGYCVSTPRHMLWILVTGVPAAVLAGLALWRWKKLAKARRVIVATVTLILALGCAASIVMMLTDDGHHQVQCPPFDLSPSR